MYKFEKHISIYKKIKRNAEKYNNKNRIEISKAKKNSKHRVAYSSREVTPIVNKR